MSDYKYEHLDNILYSYQIYTMEKDETTPRRFFDVMVDFLNKWEEMSEEDRDAIVNPFEKKSGD